MQMFDLLFIGVFIGTVLVFATAVVFALRGRRRQALRFLAGLAILIAGYLAIVVVVSLRSPQRILPVGEDRCFDDWCLAVDNVLVTEELGQGESAVKAGGLFYVVTLKLSNHARGRTQRASSTAVHLVDDQGRAFDISPQGQEAFEAEHGPALPLTSTMAVGQSLNTVQVFDLPVSSPAVGLTIEHPIGPGPGLFVIGDEASLFHKPTIMRLN